MSIFTGASDKCRLTRDEKEKKEDEPHSSLDARHLSLFEGFDRLGPRNFVATLFAGTARVVIPKILHCLTEMFDDVGAVEIDVFNKRTAVLAIEDHVFVFARRAASLDYNAGRVRRPDRGMRYIRRDEERFPLAHKVVDDVVALPNTNLNVALELIKIFFRINLVKIVSRVWAFDHHHEKIAPVVEITIADRWLEFVAV